MRVYHSKANDGLLLLPGVCIFGETCGGNGECPKHSCSRTERGETGLNTFCGGYKLFFSHLAYLSMRIPNEADRIIRWK